MEYDKPTSVIVISYQGAGSLRTCLTSLRHEMAPQDELIVVDNASTDGSADLVQQLWPSVRLVRNSENVGFASACNQAAALARGRVLVFLNQDTEVQPGWLDGLVRALSADTCVGLASSEQRYMTEPSRVHNRGADVHFSGLIFMRDLGVKGDAAGQSITPVHSVVGASFAVRREIWQELRGFDEQMWMYFEEVDLSWRAELAGYRSVVVPASVVHHDVTSDRRVALRLYYCCRNRTCCVLKTWRWQTLVLLSPGLLLAELADFAFVILAERRRGMAAKVAAYGWLLGHLPQVALRRQDCQAQRRVPDWRVLQNRKWDLDPREFTGGRWGRVFARLASLPLRANGWLAWNLLRCFGW